MNGYFRLICGTDSTSVEIFPATDGGAAVSVYEIAEYLNARNIFYDVKALNNAKDSDKPYQLVINNQAIAPVREGYKLEVSADKMTVTARFYPPSDQGDLMGEEEFIGDLGFKDITYGIDLAQIHQFFSKRTYGQDVIVASGKAVEHGKDAQISYFFETDVKIRPEMREDGTVDYFNLNMVNHCHKGEKLAQLIPEQAGNEGVNVFGEVMKPREVKKNSLKYGRNIAISEDKLEIYSEVDGHVTLVEGKVFVSDILTVENVDTSTGNIVYDGSVQVNGNVCTNFSIEAKGNITVNGIVEGAKIVAGGDIILARGINGMNRGVLKAGRNIVVKFMENTTATAINDVFAESILHSVVQAGDEVTVNGKKGFITGGRVIATNRISVKMLGSAMGSDTTVEVGSDPLIKQRLADLQKEVTDVQKIIRTVQPQLAATQQKLAKGVKLTPEQIQYMKSLLALNQQKTQELEAHVQEIEQIQHSLGKSTTAQVIVTGEVFPGAKVVIGDLSMVVQSALKYCKFIQMGGEVKMTSI